MRLSHYAKLINVSYKTAFRWWKAGRLDAYQLDTGTTIVRDPLPETPASNGIALYARVSTQGQKADLDRHVERPKTYAARRGYQVTKFVQEIASGMNDTRPKLLKLLTDPHIGRVVVELRDRLTRFGLVYIEQLFQMQGRTLQVMFPTDTTHELVDDFMAVITSMASRIYGRRHSKERTENIKRCVGQVVEQEEECAHSIQNRHWLVSSNSMRSEGKKSTQRPDLQLRMARGNDDFMVDADSEIRELEQEAEQNGYVLQWTFDQDKNDFAYTCEKMTAEEIDLHRELTARKHNDLPWLKKWFPMICQVKLFHKNIVTQ